MACSNGNLSIRNVLDFGQRRYHFGFSALFVYLFISDPYILLAGVKWLSLHTPFFFFISFLACLWISLFFYVSGRNNNRVGSGQRQNAKDSPIYV